MAPWRRRLRVLCGHAPSRPVSTAATAADGAKKLSWALKAAIDGNDRAAAEAALSAGAEIEGVLDSNGYAPLLLAARRGNAALCELFLAHGAEVGSVDRDGWTAYDLANFFGHTEVADLLSARGGADSAAGTEAAADGGTGGPEDGAASLRVLHTADLHFDPPHRRVEELLPLVLEAAEAEGASLLLLAGDIFEHGRVPEAEVALFLELLGARPGLSVALLPGNHDVGIFAEVPGSGREVPPIPPNVTVLSEAEGTIKQIQLASGQRVSVW